MSIIKSRLKEFVCPIPTSLGKSTNVNLTILTCVISTHSKFKKKPRMHYFKMNSYWHFDEKVHFWNALILQVHVMWMPILNNVSFCIPVCLKILYFFFWQNQLVLNKCKLMRITYCFIFYFFVDSNPDAPAPPESSKKSDSDSDDFGDSDNDSMSDWRW